MFKGILPLKRISSSDFTMITSLNDFNGKENRPEHPLQPSGNKPSKVAASKASTRALEKNKTAKVTQPAEPAITNQAFDKLLDDLQIPSSLRPKLANMDSSVKAAMLKSSHVLTLSPSAAPPATPRTLRRAHSSESMTPHSSRSLLNQNSSGIPHTSGYISGSALASQASASVYALESPRVGHERGRSYDVSQTLPRGLATHMLPGDLISEKSKDKAHAKNISPVKLCSILTGTSSTQLEVETVKKLRLLLRNESASWSQEFLRLGGYNALLTRLNEILEVEWREEQHDDQILHELLRCFKALSTSSIGCFALRSSCPTPFVQLVSLMYSDKRPGEVATRQLIVELLLILFDLYPSSSLPSTGMRPRKEAWEPESVSFQTSNLITFPAPHKNFYSLIRALLLTPAPPPTESPASPVSPHAFIESLHLPRIYKTYLQELSDVCRDYFWVFCHPNNTVWNLADTDEGKVEKPRAPGGMTGGVEFEAMGYMTTHLRLINAVAKAAEDLNFPKENDLSAYKFHADLFLSGLERIILVARKASTTYYPTLHLELARYIAFAGRAGYELPWTVSRLVGPPPPAMYKAGMQVKLPPRESPRKTSTTKGVGHPAFFGLPVALAAEPLKLD